MDLLIKKMILLFAIAFLICGLSKGEVYKVGDGSGWTRIGPPNYKAWAASKNFHVGDTIVFEYNKQFHNVLRVSHQNFNACNSTAPHSTWASGNDSFIIRRPGHFYFICSTPGHCEVGQKVDIRVPKSNGPRYAPSPLPSSPSPQSLPSSLTPSSPTSGPSSSAPAPTPDKNGSSSLYYSWKLCALVLAFVLKAIAI